MKRLDHFARELWLFSGWGSDAHSMLQKLLRFRKKNAAKNGRPESDLKHHLGPRAQSWIWAFRRERDSERYYFKRQPVSLAWLVDGPSMQMRLLPRKVHVLNSIP